MALTDLPDSYLADFGVDCVAGRVTGKGILDMPSQVLSDGMVLTTDYSLRAKAADFGSLVRGDSITVGGSAYTVREAMLVDDGVFVDIALSKS
jgi:hypothetical protein